MQETDTWHKNKRTNREKKLCNISPQDIQRKMSKHTESMLGAISVIILSFLIKEQEFSFKVLSLVISLAHT